MFDLYNELDDEEDDLQKIVEQTYKIFCMLLQKKKKLDWLTSIIYEEKLKMLKSILEK